MSLEDRVKNIVADKLGVEDDQVIPSASFMNDLDADSLDLVELIMAFEEEFSTDDSPVEISDEDTKEDLLKKEREEDTRSICPHCNREI